MIDPKTFYRKMDRLLAQIAEQHADENYLPSILKELELTFGEELYIGRGHLYEEVGGRFLLRSYTQSKPCLVDEFLADSATVDLVVRHDGFIFEEPNEGLDLYANPRSSDAIPVAFLASATAVHRWMFVFCLRPGWNREEIVFCLNGTRSALNYRLKAEAAQGDMEQAAEIQRSLLPAHPPEFEGFDIAAGTKPAEAVGGDLFDFIPLGNEILGVTIGDASGHGMPAALLVRDVLMGMRMGMGTHLKMLYTMKKLNRVLNKTTFSTRFISVFYGEIEKNGNILYVNAGHVPGLLFDGSSVGKLEPTGMILGPIRDISLDRAYAHIPPGGLLVLFTDGVTERVLPSNEPFEIEGLIELIQKNRSLSAAELVDCIFETALSLEHESDILDDDSTVVVIKRHEI